MRQHHAAPSRSEQPSRLERARSVLSDEPTLRTPESPDSPHPALGHGLHEWFPATGLPPFAVLIGLAWDLVDLHSTTWVYWVGERCWPYPHALLRRSPDGHDRRLLHRSVFVDAASRADRVWATEVASRGAGPRVVLGDGRGLSMAESRRLQLAAAAANTSVQLVRPDIERAELSAAQTRWRVAPQPDIGSSQAWSVELVRSRGRTDAWLGHGRARRWVVRRDHATGTINEWQAGDGGLVPELVRGPAPTPRTHIA